MNVFPARTTTLSDRAKINGRCWCGVSDRLVRWDPALHLKCDPDYKGRGRGRPRRVFEPTKGLIGNEPRACRKCGQIKEAVEFYVRAGRRRRTCAECDRAAALARYRVHASKRAAIRAGRAA